MGRTALEGEREQFPLKRKWRRAKGTRLQDKHATGVMAPSHGAAFCSRSLLPSCFFHSLSFFLVFLSFLSFSKMSFIISNFFFWEVQGKGREGMVV